MYASSAGGGAMALVFKPAGKAQQKPAVKTHEPAVKEPARKRPGKAKRAA